MILSDNETKVDMLNNRAIAKTVANVIRDCDDRPISIGVHGDWGAGKSSILVMVEDELLSKTDQDNNVVCIRFNGWQHQGFEDAKIALMSAIVSELSRNQKVSDKAKDALKKLWKNINWLSVAKAAGSAAFSLATGLPPIGLLNNLMDGLKGTEYREIPINSEICKSAKIGSVIADADVIISLNHFKGHEQAGFGGALKNIGMGSASRGGKLDLHSSSKPEINKDNCTGCHQCVKNCNYGAINLNENKKAVINYDICVGCGQCIAVCQYDAAQPVWDNASEIMNKKIAEYTFALLKNKPNFHVNFIMDVSPDCDCWSSNDMPLVPNIGIAASFDPVALDHASADLVTQAPAIKGNILNPEGEHDLVGEDKFHHVHPNTNWMVGLDHAEKIGLGNKSYELIVV